MGRSLALGLYLLLARRGAAALPRPADAPRQGQVIWLRAGPGAALAALGHLARRMQRDRPALRFVLTRHDPVAPAASDFPPGTEFVPAPADRTGPVRVFLDRWSPDLIVMTGGGLPPALVVEATRLGIPTVLADARRPQVTRHRWQPGGALAAALLPRLTRILAQDPDAAEYYQRLGGRDTRIEITGRIEETTEPLACTEAERDELAALLAARPVWLAVACPPAEEEAVIATHRHVLRLAHRMLLILVPTDPGRAPALTDRLQREGWNVALRAREEEPEPEAQVFVTDGETELGLWYRLAPVTFMGGTLHPGGGRSPMEPAALGSAIVHGPHVAPYPEAYARLTEARAARLVDSPAALTATVAELIAPDRAAILAHNAWAAASGGSEVTDRVIQILFAHLDGGQSLPPGKGA